MTVAIQANILAIHEKLMDILSKGPPGPVPSGAQVLLQGAGKESLRWTDGELDAFLQGPVQSKFGVLVQRRHIRSTMNGMDATVGDLAIAISAAIQRQHRPARRLVH